MLLLLLVAKNREEVSQLTNFKPSLDRPFHNLRPLKSANQRFRTTYIFPRTYFEALKLRMDRSGLQLFEMSCPSGGSSSTAKETKLERADF